MVVRTCSKTNHSSWNRNSRWWTGGTGNPGATFICHRTTRNVWNMANSGSGGGGGGPFGSHTAEVQTTYGGNGGSPGIVIVIIPFLNN